MINIRKIKSLSLVIPCNNEQDAIKISLKIYLNALKNLVVKNIISKYEVIIVNNGSTDKTLEVLLKEKRNNSIKIIDLKKNYGYTSSYLAGMYYAKNEIIITVSADLHEDPDKIKDLILKHYISNKPVMAVYKKRHETFLKNFFSDQYYRFLNLIKIPIIKNHADFRLITNKINLNFFNSLPSFVFIRIRILDFFDSYEIVYYFGNNRKIGRTKFNFISSALLALDTILFYAKTLIKKSLLRMTLIFWLSSLILILLSFKTEIILLSVTISLLFSLLNFFLIIRIRALELKRKHFEVNKII